MRKLSSVLNSALVETVGDKGLGNMPVVAATRLTDSPIEAQLMMHITRYDFVVGLEKGLTLEAVRERARAQFGRVVVFPQVWIGDFRPDFLFARAGRHGVVGLVVEADGMDWHYDDERRIIHDNDRLAAFAKANVFTMRFLGRQIWKECELVIDHIREFFDGRD